MKPYVDKEKCIGCGACQNICPAEPVVFEVEEKSEVGHPETCIECGQRAETRTVVAMELAD